MTTKLAYQVQTEIDYDSLSFNPDEPEPLPDAMYQYPILQEILHILDMHVTSLHSSEEVFRSSNTFICYDPSNLNVRVGPDFYAAFGVDALAIERRKLYLPWEVGKPPDFVLEVGSESTAENDLVGKRRTYAQIGVAEYWRYDRTGGDFYGQSLAGERLVNGVYQSIELTTEPDGVLKGYSPAMRLSLCCQGDMLTFYYPETGEYLRNLPAEKAARLAAEETARTERGARLAAEARIRQLEEELRRRQGEP